MKEIKLRKVNSFKFCPICNKIMEIKMAGLYGFCSFCDAKLYTINSHREYKKDISQVKK